MRKTIKFIPIYNGEFNMTPSKSQEIEDEIYRSRRVIRTRIRNIEYTILAIATSYLVLSILGVWR